LDRGWGEDVKRRLGCAAAGLTILAAALSFATTSEAARYNHARHATAAKKDIACNNCHKLSEKTGWLQKTPIGKAGEVHTPCSNAGCHQSTYLSLKRSRKADFCFTCHVSKLGKKLIFPPYRERGPSDFYLAKFSHEVHIQAEKENCEACHQVGLPGLREMKRAGHDACSEAACHGEQIKPLMASCAGCHADRRPQDGVEPASALMLDAYRVRPPFSHIEHKKKSKDDACNKCHANVGVRSGQAPPLPPMAACEKCHDGEAAFRALGTTCQKCHTRSEAVSAAMALSSTKTSTAGPPKPLVFEHQRHAIAVGLAIKECGGCHEGTKTNGRLKFPGQLHKPCSNDACHAAEFRKRGTTFCAVCHQKTEPFGKNPLKTSLVVPASGRIEFDVPFSHKSHLAKKPLAGSGGKTGAGSCARCHAREMGQRTADPPAGVLAPAHELCSSCHEAVANPKMLDCAGCHRLAGSAAQAEGAGVTADGTTYRVKAKFSHVTHRFDQRLGKEKSVPLACKECHGDVEQAGPGQAIPHPKMAECAKSCHDGKIAFKTTGFGCTKCHGDDVAP
jgi:hypothetical protein